jgi:hypothetical protein
MWLLTPLTPPRMLLMRPLLLMLRTPSGRHLTPPPPPLTPRNPPLVGQRVAQIVVFWRTGATCLLNRYGHIFR